MGGDCGLSEVGILGTVGTGVSSAKNGQAGNENPWTFQPIAPVFAGLRRTGVSLLGGSRSRRREPPVPTRNLPLRGGGEGVFDRSTKPDRFFIRKPQSNNA